MKGDSDKENDDVDEDKSAGLFMICFNNFKNFTIEPAETFLTFFYLFWEKIE